MTFGREKKGKRGQFGVRAYSIMAQGYYKRVNKKALSIIFYWGGGGGLLEGAAVAGLEMAEGGGDVGGDDWLAPWIIVL